MIVILVPFFLAAQLRDAGWPQGAAESSYRFSVNSTAVSDSSLHEPDRSTRFDMSAMLKCRFRGPASLICRMTDSKAVSFASTTVDPTVPGEPLPDTMEDHAEYQLAEEAFEITFTPNGVGKILVNRTVSPGDLNMIRAIVNQLNIGANIAKKREPEFRHMEKSIIGKCDTVYHISKNSSGDFPGNNATWEDDYKLSGLESLGRRKGETMRLEKWRNVNKCSLRADYFFGSREGFRTDPSDMEARIVQSESSMYVSDTNFASNTFNELQIARQRGEDLIIYEHYSLTLASIDPAETAQPISIVDPASASVYAYQYVDDDEESAELVKRARATRPASSFSSSSSATMPRTA
ncbi:uncharacterized protein LOC100677876 isoform X2 [Nasonia vitripennis]|uniref:Vitellogenin domain-containing protein n=1 Tax=Nasonia vitripennis TaxID=7425 RepID=A0A7M7H6N6_NASVI|nr:uncharacterized protein LOC100677876 isoform X2 [Nasonia vitripennis]